MHVPHQEKGNTVFLLEVKSLQKCRNPPLILPDDTEPIHYTALVFPAEMDLCERCRRYTARHKERLCNRCVEVINKAGLWFWRGVNLQKRCVCIFNIFTTLQWVIDVCKVVSSMGLWLMIKRSKHYAVQKDVDIIEWFLRNKCLKRERCKQVCQWYDAVILSVQQKKV